MINVKFLNKLLPLFLCFTLYSISENGIDSKEDIINKEKSSKKEDKKSSLVCSIIITKNPCWKDIKIKGKVDAPELLEKSVLAEFDIEENIIEKVIEFKCVKNKLLGVELDFEPKVLQRDAKKIYRSKARWMIPNSLPENALKWQVSLCFPDDFGGIYDPYHYKKECKCAK